MIDGDAMLISNETTSSKKGGLYNLDKYCEINVSFSVVRRGPVSFRGSSVARLWGSVAVTDWGRVGGFRGGVSRLRSAVGSVSLVSVASLISPVSSSVLFLLIPSKEDKSLFPAVAAIPTVAIGSIAISVVSLIFLLVSTGCGVEEPPQQTKGV